MTSYSILPQGDERFSIVSTWPGSVSDHSVKVTSLASREDAQSIAFSLTTLSEAAWYAAAWLDTWDATRSHLSDLIAWLRSATLSKDEPAFVSTGCRHQDIASSAEYAEAATDWLPFVASALSHTQRLAVADELAIEFAAMIGALEEASHGTELDEESRQWQFLESTRALSFGNDLSLIEGAPRYARINYDAFLMSERWEARGHILRLDQFAAAAVASGGRGGTDPESFQASAIFEFEDDPDGEARTVVKVESPWVGNSHLFVNRRLPMTVKRVVGYAGQFEQLGVVDPYDTDGFAELVGDWIYAAPMP